MHAFGSSMGNGGPAVHALHDVEFSFAAMNVYCSNLERSERFYREILGFAVMARAPQCVRMSCGRQQFLLIAHPHEDAAEGRGTLAAELAICLHVDDVAHAYEYFASENVMRSQWTPGETAFFIRDPDGLLLEIREHD
jgi:catechol 2,3-dioxygenase-like lactoylglutathione lyase family enzyme